MAKPNKNQQKKKEGTPVLPSQPLRKDGKVIYRNLEADERLTSVQPEGEYKTIYRKLSDLKKLPNNPRFIKDADFERLCKSIKDNPDYFEARPLILSDRTGELVIIAGNQRYEAALFNQLAEAPTFLMKGLDEKREKEIIIRDNINNGQWDWDKLANEWDQINLNDWGVPFDDMNKTVSFQVNKEKEIDENLKTENECPSCHYRW